MTLHPLHGGDGYTYLTREVATADVRRTRGQKITDYYHAEGNPPGLWYGRATTELEVEGTVTEAQMRALFGEGLHPNADAMMEKLIADGMSAKDAEQQVRLGRKPLKYEPVTTYQERVKQRYAAHRRITGTPPNADERARLARQMGAQMFKEQHARRPKDAAELMRYIAQVAKPKPQAVTGFDLVFTPPKSVSVLWALGDEPTRRVIEQAHDQAWQSVISDAENSVIKTRTGHGGIAQLDVTSGVAAAAFRHYDSRTGDPNLHTHVAIPNRVKTADGRWRTIDGRALFSAGVSMSESYNTRVTHAVAEAIGGTTVAVDAGRGRRPVYEIAGVSDDLRTQFSGRRASISARTAELVDRYVRDHGHEPAEDVRHKLSQQATLENRPPKKHARSLAVMRQEWRQQATAAVGRRRVDRLLTDVRRAARDAASITTNPSITADPTIALPAEQVDDIARTAVAVVEQQRATWTRHHIEAEVHRQLSAAGLGAHESVAAKITDAALNRASIRITAPSTEPTMAELTRRDGESVFTHAQTVRYSSERILAAETRVVEAARATVIAPVSGELFDQTLATVQAAPGARQLDPGQVAVARAFATDGRLVVAGIGPAGAGKTTTMNVVARAVEAAGGRVIGLAPSARAASVLSADIAVPAHTVHRWLHHRREGSPGQQWQLRTGDLILIDEAGMAGTLNLDAVIAEARQAGAVVRLLGDPQQLGAVESGGMLRLVQREAGAVELDRIHRFVDPAEAAASLQLRDGTEDAWRWYWSKDRVQHGDREAMLDHVYQAWRAETAAGEHSLMIAPTNEDTRQLNDRARADRIAAGQVDAAGVELHDGTQAGRGDLIVTRRNNSRLRLFSGRDMVLNGDVWVIQEHHRNGALSVRHTQHGGRIQLPSSYVSTDVELAYATTIHRAQGMTVDKVHAMIDGTVSRVQAYVALTRGRLNNSIYVITEAGNRVHETLDSIRRNFGAAISATEAMRDSLTENEYLPNIANRYRYIADEAADNRHRGVVSAAFKDTAEDIFKSPAWARVAAAFARAERSGWSARDILDAAGTARLSSADDPAAVLAHRIRAAHERGAAALATADQRPLAGLSDTALEPLRSTAKQRLHDAETALAWAHHDAAELPKPVRVKGVEQPAWPDRPHGALSDTALVDAHRQTRTELDHIERRLTAARRRTREASTPDQQHTAERHRGHVEAQARTTREHADHLRAEQRLRAVMRPKDRARETAQRADTTTPATAPALTAARASTEQSTELAARRIEQARTIITRIDDEAAWRQRLPTAFRHTEQARRNGRPTTPGPDVPNWIADTRHLASRDTSRWATHLEERREHLAERLADMAREVAAQQPQWATDTLGQRPDSNPGKAAAWDRAAAQAAAYRQTFAVDDVDTRILGREPRPDSGLRREAYEQTRATIEPVRAERARANRAAGAADARAELRRKLQQAAARRPIDSTDLSRTPTVDRGRQTSEDTRQRTARQEQQRQAAEQRQAEQTRTAEQQRQAGEERRADEQRRAAEQQRGRRPGPSL